MSKTEQQSDERQVTYQVRTVRFRQSLHTEINFAAFNNVPYNYKLHPSFVTGKMNKMCEYCYAHLFKNKAPGMCYTDRKVKLQDLHSPSESLPTLLSDDRISKHFLSNIRKYNLCFQMTSLVQ